MRYPIQTPNLIDVTKPPYCADPTGKTDCTRILCRVLDDLLGREAEGFRRTVAKMESLPGIDGRAFIGFEDRKYIYNGNSEMDIIFPEFVPDAKIIYFPAGTYLVSGTVECSLDLKNYYHSKPFCQLARGIHFLGESKETVTVKLADHSAGFEEGSAKPVISYIAMDEEHYRREITNVAQMNTFADITVDCGKGNPGAVALRFVSSNSGSIRNAAFRSEGSLWGIQTAYGSEGVGEDLTVVGFDCGVRSTDTSPLHWNRIRMQNIRSACFLSGGGKSIYTNIESDAPLLAFSEGHGVYFTDVEGIDKNLDCKGNTLYVRENGAVSILGEISENASENRSWKPSLEMPSFPQNPRPGDSDCAFVGDFGADPTGQTDASAAVQAAMDSGKSVILFGGGHYLLNREITVPATVKTVDFLFSDLFAGEDIKQCRDAGLFAVTEDSDALLSFENLYTFEQLHGHFRLIRHSAKRNLLLKDLHTQTLAMYFNTVPGSVVFLDNCACTTGTYSQDAILHRDGKVPEFCGAIPYEFHGQTVFARNLNPERADVEVLNDASVLLIYGLKCEGPGTMLRAVNGGKSEILTLHAGIGKTDAVNPLFDIHDSSVGLFGLRIGGFPPALLFNRLVAVNGEDVFLAQEIHGYSPANRTLIAFWC